MANKPWHRDRRFVRQGQLIREAAYRDPTTMCWRCGLTLTEARTQRGDHIRWDCGHVIDGDPNSELRAEHSDCNRSAGARRGNAKRSTGYDWP